MAKIHYRNKSYMTLTYVMACGVFKNQNRITTTNPDRVTCAACKDHMQYGPVAPFPEPNQEDL